MASGLRCGGWYLPCSCWPRVNTTLSGETTLLSESAFQQLDARTGCVACSVLVLQYPRLKWSPSAIPAVKHFLTARESPGPLYCLARCSFMELGCGASPLHWLAGSSGATAVVPCFHSVSLTAGPAAAPGARPYSVGIVDADSGIHQTPGSEHGDPRQYSTAPRRPCGWTGIGAAEGWPPQTGRKRANWRD